MEIIDRNVIKQEIKLATLCGFRYAMNSSLHYICMEFKHKNRKADIHIIHPDVLRLEDTVRKVSESLVEYFLRDISVENLAKNDRLLKEKLADVKRKAKSTYEAYYDATKQFILENLDEDLAEKIIKSADEAMKQMEPIIKESASMYVERKNILDQKIEDITQTTRKKLMEKTTELQSISEENHA